MPFVCLIDLYDIPFSDALYIRMISLKCYVFMSLRKMSSRRSRFSLSDTLARADNTVGNGCF
jgi:hypothetical protein